MDSLTQVSPFNPKTAGPFLPLALRFAASFSLLLLHFALEPNLSVTPAGERLYVAILGVVFIESVYESARMTIRSGSPFAVPSHPWVLANLFLLCMLVALLVAFHGVSKAGLAALYVFPVLASAFYVGITTITAVGTVSAVMYALCVLMFAGGTLPPFGQSGIEGGIQKSEQVWLIAFTTLQITIATLVVATIRKRLETLGTSLRGATAEVGEISALYRNVFESMNSGLLTTDLEGLLTSANPSAERIMPFALEMGRPLGILDTIGLLPPGASPEVYRFECGVSTPGSPETTIGGTISPLMDSEDRQTGYLLLFEDLSDRKAMEAKMRLNERLAAIGELSSELAHEMRTPIASVQGCVQILRRPNADGTLVDRVLTILMRETERIGAVVSDFLDVAKPRDLKMGWLWLPELLNEVRGAWDTDPRFAGLPLEIAESPKVWIHGDALAFHQVLTNLLSNSRKAVQGKKSPWIRVFPITKNDSLELTVVDNGMGMGKTQISEIFVPFRSGFGQGTGIGMSLVYQLIQRMSWEIFVESEVAVGTTVKLVIPAGKRT